MKHLEGTVGAVLVQICRAHRQKAQLKLGELGLYTGQEMILLKLGDTDGLNQSQLVETLCVEPPTVTKMLNRMVASGLVERQQDLQDARIQRVYLTEQGRALQEPILQVWRELEEETLIGLNEAERLLLRRLLLQVQTNLV